MKKVIAIVMLLVVLASSVYPQSPQTQAERFVQSTWTEADATAKMLIARDFYESFNEIAATLAASTASNAQAQKLPALRAQLLNALETASGTSLQEVAASEQKLPEL